MTHACQRRLGAQLVGSGYVTYDAALEPIRLGIKRSWTPAPPRMIGGDSPAARPGFALEFLPNVDRLAQRQDLESTKVLTQRSSAGRRDEVIACKHVNEANDSNDRDDRHVSFAIKPRSRRRTRLIQISTTAIGCRMHNRSSRTFFTAQPGAPPFRTSAPRS